MDFRIALYALVLGEIKLPDFPALAQEAILDGYDSPSLYELLKSEGLGDGVIEHHLCASLQELGFKLPTQAEAVRSKIFHYLQRIVDGELAPEEGAFRIFDMRYNHEEIDEEFPELIEEVYFIDQDPKYSNHTDREILEKCKKDIVNLAKKYLSSPPAFTSKK